MPYKYDTQTYVVQPSDDDVSLKTVAPYLFKNLTESSDWSVQIFYGEGVGLRFINYLDPTDTIPNVDIRLTFPRFILTRQFGHIAVEGLHVRDILVSGSNVVNVPDATGAYNATTIQVLMIGG